MRVKTVYLKFNREKRGHKICLDSWLNIFDRYKKVLVTDNLTDPKNIRYIDDICKKHNMEKINTNYSLADPYLGFLDKTWINAAAVNLTCFKREQEPFWLIDADDTLFLTKDFDDLKSRFRLAEDYFFNNNLDAFSLDFYRELASDHWSFGVTLINPLIDLSKLQKVARSDAENRRLICNLDSAFDCLRIKREYRLKSFIFDRCFFQHHADNPRYLPYGVYYWENRSLWGHTPIREDVISI